MLGEPQVVERDPGGGEQGAYGILSVVEPSVPHGAMTS